MGASVLSRLVVELTMKDKGFSKGAQEAEKSAGRLRKVLGSVASTAGGFLVAGVIAKGFSAIKSQIGGIISAGSDLNETLSKSSAVFGENAAQVQKWADSAAQNVGMSKQAALEGASTVGNLLKGVGVANKDLPVMSENLLQASADLGSFNNVDPAEVLENLRSGLVGQAEPLRKYGILISETAVKAKAMEMGLADANGELSEGAKVQARYALIMEQVGDAQGDFAKTSGGLANGSRILHANIQNLKGEIGMKLVPILAKATTGVNKMFSTFNDFRTKGMSPWMAAVNTLQKGLTKAFGAGTATSITATILDAGDKIRRGWKEVIDWFQKHKGDILSVVKALITAWWTLEKIGYQVFRLLVKVIEWAWSKIEAPFHRFIKFIRGLDFNKGALGDLMDIFQALAKGDLDSALKEISNLIGEVGDRIADFLDKHGLGTVGKVIRKTFKDLAKLFKDTVNLIDDLIHGRWSKVWKDFANICGDLVMLAIDRIAIIPALVWDIFKAIPWRSIGTSVVNGLVDVGNWALDQIKKLPGLWIDAIIAQSMLFYNAGRTLISWIWTGIASLWDWFLGSVSNLPGAAIGALEWAGGMFFNFGRDIMSNIWRGIVSLWDWLLGMVSTIPQGVLGALLDVAGFSPIDHATQYVGEQAMKGLAKGIKDNVGMVLQTADQVTNALFSGGSFGGSVTAGAGAGASGSGGGSMVTYSFAPGSIVVNGAQDAEAVASEILKAVQREQAARH